jgi:3-mercaptopyruvate sulfurtransferase SseA
MRDGFLKPPIKLRWKLSAYGITSGKTFITTCDTGLAAADAFLILRYPGFPEGCRATGIPTATDCTVLRFGYFAMVLSQ